MLELFDTSIQVNGEISLVDSLLRLGFTFILTFALAVAYRRLHREKINNHVMMHSMIYIGVILCGAMMVIGSNLVVAFGLLGAVSIIRFRTVVENSVDMSYLFLAIVVGISSGLGLLVHALVLTAFVTVLMFFLNRFRIGMDPPEYEPYSISITASKSILTAAIISQLRNRLGNESTLMSVDSNRKTLRVKFIKPLANVGEVYRIHREIEEIVGEDKSLVIKVLKK